MNGYRMKKIALPGGRVIEIVYFSDPDPHPERDHELATEPTRNHVVGALHVCEECGSDLVYPVAWEEDSEETWWVMRRCPECEWHHDGTFHHSEVEHFDDVLNEGTEELLTQLRSFARANMEEDVERWVHALERDLIEPMDF